MTLKIFDSKSNSLKEFRPVNPGIVSMYVCGPTVYDDAHIGHARSYVSFDVMRRYLEHEGHEVRMVINITDLDDVIDAKAARLGERPEAVAERFERRFLEDLQELNIRPPFANPRVSENVPSMVGIVEELNEKGYIYEIDGNHYFRVSLPGGYGQLTHRSPEDLLADSAVAGNRENPFDFLIWKKGKEGLRTWDSSLGSGRPGWHVQCYSIMKKVLGEDVDIHGGGEDLKFPHHESNILLSRAHIGRDSTRYHVHNGFMTLGKKKMSKSLGNFVSLRDIFERFGGSAIRLYLLRHHYRETIDYDENDIERAQEDLNMILGLVKELGKSQKQGEPRDSIVQGIESLRWSFLDSMNTDLDTSGAVDALLELSRWIKPFVSDIRRSEAKHALNFLREADEILGLSGTN